MDRLNANACTRNAGKTWLIPGAIAFVTLVICGTLAVGWTVQCGRLTTANDKLTAENQRLGQQFSELQTRFNELAAQSGQTIEELMAMNRTLAEANEGFAAEVADIRKTLETIVAENRGLMDQITELHQDARRQTAESAKYIEDLTQTVMKLTEEAGAANARLGGLVAQLQAKTDEAAEQAIRINTLVEMVARLRVLVGTTGEQQHVAPSIERLGDPNSTAPEPPA